MANSRLRVLELTALTSILAFTLAGASLAWVGYRIFFASRAQTMTCEQGCDSMTNATQAEKDSCKAGCSSGGYMGSSSCGSGCGSISDPTAYQNCMAGCATSGGGSYSANMNCTKWKTELFSPSANAVVGYEECPGMSNSSGGCTRKNPAGTAVCVSPGMGGGGSTGPMADCFYPNANINGAPAGFTVFCASDYVNCRKGDANGEAVSTAGLALGAPSTCGSGFGMSGTAGGSTPTCTGGIPSYPDAYPKGTAVCIEEGGSSGSSSTSQSPDLSDDEGYVAPKIANPVKDAEELRIRLLDELGDNRACRHPEAEKNRQNTLFYGEFVTKALLRYGVSLETYMTFPLCDIAELIDTMGLDCQSFIDVCVKKARSVLYSSMYENPEDGERAFDAAVSACVAGKAKEQGIDCAYTGGGKDMVKVRGVSGVACDNDKMCPNGQWCNKDDYHERPPMNRGSLSAALVPDVFWGRCEDIEREPGQCFSDSHCPSGQQCAVLRVDCQQGKDCPQPLGFCQERTHNAADEEEKGDCRPVTRADVASQGLSPAEVEKVYIEAVESYLAKEGMGRTVTQYESCQSPGDEDNDEEEAGDDENRDETVMQDSLASVFSEAIRRFIRLLEEKSKLPSSVVSTIQEAMTWFGQQIVAIASGEKVNVKDALSWVHRVKDAVPENAAREIFDNEDARQDRGNELSGSVRFELHKVGSMLDWINMLITELKSTDYSGKDAKKEAQWEKMLASARDAFYGPGGVEERCNALMSTLRQGDLSGGEDTMAGCRNGIENIFRPLEITMKPAIESLMSSGDATLMSIMQNIGQPPMDEGGEHGGGGGPEYGGGDSCFSMCERKLHVEDLITQSDKHCVPQECIENEDAPGCEAKVDECDAKYLGPLKSALDQCVASCEMSQGGNQNRDNQQDWRREQVQMQDECYKVSNKAGEMLCQMQSGAAKRVSMLDVDRLLKEWGALMCTNVHPDPSKYPVLGVDIDCPASFGQHVDCDMHWRKAEEKCKKNYQMDYACFKGVVAAFPDECRPPADDPIWKMEDQWRDQQKPMISMPVSGTCTFASVMHKDGRNITGLSCSGGDSCTGYVGSAQVTVKAMNIIQWGQSSCSGGMGGGQPMLGGGMSGMYGCTYPGATWVTGNTHGKASGTPVAGGVKCMDNDSTAANCTAVTANIYLGSNARTQVSLGPPDHCDSWVMGSPRLPVPPDGGTSVVGTPASGCSYSSGTLKSTGKAVTYVSCPMETPNICNTSEGQVSYADLTVPAPNACASGGGGMTGGTTGGTAGGTPGTSGDRCFNTNVKKSNGEYIGYTVDCTFAGTDCRYGSPTGDLIDMTGVNLGTERNCYYLQGNAPGGSTTYPTYPGSTMTCYYPAKTYDPATGKITGTLSEQVSEMRNADGSMPSYSGGSSSMTYVGKTTGTKFTNIEPDYSKSDCNGDGQPDSSYTSPEPTGMAACGMLNVSVMSSGQKLSESITCSSSVCRGVSTGTEYSSRALSWQGACSDCDKNNECDGTSYPSGTSGGTSPSGTTTQPTGSTCTTPWVTFNDNTRYDGVVTCPPNSPPGSCSKADGSSIDPATVATWGPFTCTQNSSQEGGMLRTIGSILRWVIVGF